MTQITVLVPTFNREDSIEECLASLRWADEILVVDSFSRDHTLEICRKYTDRILQHEYVNSATQKNWALQFVRTEWVLQIDSDESVEPALAEEMRAALSRPGEIDGYRIRIKNLVWGQWVQGCDMYPCSQVRFFQTAKGHWSDREVHAHLIGLKAVGDLQGHIIHRDLKSTQEQLLQFSSQVMEWEFRELLKRGQRWHWWDVTLRPAAIFLLYYLGKQGWREGFRGFYLSVYRAFYSFMMYTRLYEDEIYRGLVE